MFCSAKAFLKSSSFSRFSIAAGDVWESMATRNDRPLLLVLVNLALPASLANFCFELLPSVAMSNSPLTVTPGLLLFCRVVYTPILKLFLQLIVDHALGYVPHFPYFRCPSCCVLFNGNVVFAMIQVLGY